MLNTKQCTKEKRIKCKLSLKQSQYHTQVNVFENINTTHIWIILLRKSKIPCPVKPLQQREYIFQYHEDGSVILTIHFTRHLHLIEICWEWAQKNGASSTYKPTVIKMKATVHKRKLKMPEDRTSNFLWIDTEFPTIATMGKRLNIKPDDQTVANLHYQKCVLTSYYQEAISRVSTAHSWRKNTKRFVKSNCILLVLWVSNPRTKLKYRPELTSFRTRKHDAHHEKWLEPNSNSVPSVCVRTEWDDDNGVKRHTNIALQNLITSPSKFPWRFFSDKLFRGNYACIILHKLFYKFKLFSKYGGHVACLKNCQYKTKHCWDLVATAGPFPRMGKCPGSLKTQFRYKTWIW